MTRTRRDAIFRILRELDRTDARRASGRALLCGLGAPAVLEAVDVMFGVGDRGVRIEPGEADFERGEGIAVDDQRVPIGSTEPGRAYTPPRPARVATENV